jgi:hypothetical protein
MLDKIFSSLFGNMIEAKKNRYKSAFRAKVQMNTVGRVQGKVNEASAKMDQQIYGAGNRLRGKGKDAAADKQKKGGAGGAPGEQAQGGAAQGKRQPPAKGQKGQKMGLFGNKKAGGSGPARHQGPYCPQGHPVDPSWDVCPECLQLGGASASAPAQSGGGFGPMANYGGQQGEEKTQAIDLRQFQKEDRQVVGWIVAQSGNHRGLDFRLFNGKNVIGTAADCDIVVTDGFLSARHCTIRYESGNFVVIDLDSRNGTYVNQKKISKEDLIDNDTLRLGKTDFKFKSLF